MNSLDAIAIVLDQAGQPLHYRQITENIIRQGLWRTAGKTPEATINSNLAKDIRQQGESSRFQRIDSGIYALRARMLDYIEPSAADDSKETSQPISTVNSKTAPSNRRVTFADAAEYVLDHYANKQPMHYRSVTEKILGLGLVQTEGLTPEATLYAQVLSEIKQQTKTGDTPRFIKYGRGYIGLRQWMGEGLAFQIRQHNNEIRKKLLASLQNISPAEFEELVALLLVSMGFEEVIITPLQGDKGIDVRGTLVVGSVIRIRMAVQAKRWKKNVQAPIVQQVRGSLGTHNQGLIITTSDFSNGAYYEANRPDATPVGLMNGRQLVELMIEHEINVRRTEYKLIELEVTDNNI